MKNGSLAGLALAATLAMGIADARATEIWVQNSSGKGGVLFIVREEKTKGSSLRGSSIEGLGKSGLVVIKADCPCTVSAYHGGNSAELKHIKSDSYLIYTGAKEFIRGWKPPKGGSRILRKPPPLKISHLAKGKKAAQSSTYYKGSASRAVDGNTNAGYGGNSITHTKKDSRPWWQVDLGAVYKIDKIQIYDRVDDKGKSYGGRLNGAVVMVSDWPFTGNPRKAVKGDGIFRRNIKTAKPINTLSIKRTGRYVQVRLPAPQYLSLAEVAVLGADTAVEPSTPRPRFNLAKGGKAAQSSTDSKGVARRAVDGDTNGDFAAKSVSRTTNKGHPWWQVDLGKVREIDEIKIHNRTDCCGERLNGAVVMVSARRFRGNPLKDGNGRITRFVIETAARVHAFKVAKSARYVRVQIPRNEHLQLAEVEVLGYK
jgi:hypothetical protein